MTKQAKIATGVLVLIAAGAVVFLSVGGIGKNLVYYWTPTELIAAGQKAEGAVIRLGGMVEGGSIQWDQKSNDLRFRVTDGEKTVAVHGRSVPPQMFRENIGVVVEGTMGGDGTFVCDRLLVKHDNEYKPPEKGAADVKDLSRTLSGGDS